jgi:hypothetical protein
MKNLRLFVFCVNRTCVHPVSIAATVRVYLVQELASSVRVYVFVQSAVYMGDLNVLVYVTDVEWLVHIVANVVNAVVFKIASVAKIATNLCFLKTSVSVALFVANFRRVMPPLTANVCVVNNAVR